jgi:hypothetical protein
VLSFKMTKRPETGCVSAETGPKPRPTTAEAPTVGEDPRWKLAELARVTARACGAKWLRLSWLRESGCGQARPTCRAKSGWTSRKAQPSAGRAIAHVMGEDRTCHRRTPSKDFSKPTACESSKGATKTTTSPVHKPGRAQPRCRLPFTDSKM